MAKGKLKEVIEFLQNPCDNGWDRDELINDYVSEILKKAGYKTIYADELILYDGMDDKNLVLIDFVNAFFDKIIEGVVNIIKTA